jgi:ABC-type molybdate transport system permease subunit
VAEEMKMMAEIGNYLESHRKLRIAFSATGFVVASVSLYMAVTALLFMGDGYLMIAVLLLVVLGFDVGIAWLLQRHTRRSFWLTIAFTSGAVVLGAIFVSMGVWHGHWAETVKELTKELLRS